MGEEGGTSGKVSVFRPPPAVGGYEWAVESAGVDLRPRHAFLSEASQKNSEACTSPGTGRMLSSDLSGPLLADLSLALVQSSLMNRKCVRRLARLEGIAAPNARVAPSFKALPDSERR